jgi:hypothetical protein
MNDLPNWFLFLSEFSFPEQHFQLHTITPDFFDEEAALARLN